MAKQKPKDITIIRFNKVIDLMLYGTKEYTHPDNIKEEIPPKTPLTMKQAVLEVGMSYQNFNYITLNHPNLRRQYEEVKELRRERMRLIAEDNIEQWLSGKLDIDDKELMDYSFRMMEKTSKEYNPKLEVEANVNKYMLELSDEELLLKIKELTND